MSDGGNNALKTVYTPVELKHFFKFVIHRALQNLQWIYVVCIYRIQLLRLAFRSNALPLLPFYLPSENSFICNCSFLNRSIRVTFTMQHGSCSDLPTRAVDETKTFYQNECYQGWFNWPINGVSVSSVVPFAVGTHGRGSSWPWEEGERKEGWQRARTWREGSERSEWREKMAHGRRVAPTGRLEPPLDLEREIVEHRSRIRMLRSKFPSQTGCFRDRLWKPSYSTRKIECPREQKEINLSGNRFLKRCDRKLRSIDRTLKIFVYIRRLF